MLHQSLSCIDKGSAVPEKAVSSSIGFGGSRVSNCHNISVWG